MARHTLGTLLQEGVSPARALEPAQHPPAPGRLLAVRHGRRSPCCARPPAASTVRLDLGRAPRAGRAAARPGRAGRRAAAASPLGRAAERQDRARPGCASPPGDTLLMFTDGLTESRDADGVMFEERRCGRRWTGCAAPPSRRWSHELSQASATSVRGADDIAVLAIQARSTRG